MYLFINFLQNILLRKKETEQGNRKRKRKKSV